MTTDYKSWEQFTNFGHDIRSIIISDLWQHDDMYWLSIINIALSVGATQNNISSTNNKTTFILLFDKFKYTCIPLGYE